MMLASFMWLPMAAAQTFVNERFIGSGAQGSVDGTGTSALVSLLYSMARDSSGNVYATEFQTHKIRRFSDSGIMTTFAGNGNAGSVDGSGATMNFPTGIAIDTSDHIYVSQTGSHLIRRITPAGHVSTFVGSGTAGSTDGTGTSASFSGPAGMAFDSSGNLFVCEEQGRRIRRVTPAGVVTTFAGNGLSTSIDGTGTSASFTAPTFIAIDNNNNLYVTEPSSNLLRKITPAGVVTTFAGSTTMGLVDGVGTAARFSRPTGILFHSDGHLYVADRTNFAIRKIAMDGTVTTVVTTGATFESIYGIVQAGSSFYVTQAGSALSIQRLRAGCANGQYFSGSICIACPANTFSNSPGATTCTNCATGYVSLAG
jgi:sugar lactone lactonase YvrE